ncbi:unnamed protein product [Protopolystoma xenopodis]|uniref:Uncharacterized protein n=1 Tax=Protopolystoma xenopodis TaxID=117903 RepID=A0A448X546_9PLAT|nr:unnamed protein product [Protopolystoma xenopodis]
MQSPRSVLNLSPSATSGAGGSSNSTSPVSPRLGFSAPGIATPGMLSELKKRNMARQAAEGTVIQEEGGKSNNGETAETSESNKLRPRPSASGPLAIFIGQ